MYLLNVSLCDPVAGQTRSTSFTLDPAAAADLDLTLVGSWVGSASAELDVAERPAVLPLRDGGTLKPALG